ncbi:MAG: hypothetical protein ACK574_11950 [Bacteroidota bacterium]
MKKQLQNVSVSPLALKKHLFESCRLVLDERIRKGQQMLEELKNDAQNDAKSSAGDKHETAISMMQLEQEKLNRQLHEYARQKDALEKLVPDSVHVRVMPGSVVTTGKGEFYLITALGSLPLSQEVIQCISPNAPLAVALMGKSIGDRVQFMNQVYEIREVV